MPPRSTPLRPSLGGTRRWVGLPVSRFLARRASIAARQTAQGGGGDDAPSEPGPSSSGAAPPLVAGRRPLAPARPVHGAGAPRRRGPDPPQSAQAAAGGGNGGSGSPNNAPSTSQPADAATTPSTPADQASSQGFSSSPGGLRAFHVIAFLAILASGLTFLVLLLYFTAGIKFDLARDKVLKRLLKTVALRQVAGILAALVFVRFGLEPLVRGLRSAFSTAAAGPWEKSSEYYILREVYKPLEVLFAVAAVATLAENFLPQLIALPKTMVQTVVRGSLSLTFVLAAARVVFNVKARITREAAWRLELKGDLTKQRRLEAVDKLFSVLFLLTAAVFGLQAIGLDVNSVLAIGGVGGLAVGLAGREILENLFTGLIILSSSPFEVGDEVQFAPPTGERVEGIVIDVGWYRTTIRSFEREVYCIPNSVFSRNVVLNVTRKGREWRFFERLGLRVEDVGKAGAVVADMRKVLRADPRIIQKLHRRVFLETVDRDQATVYLSFYVEAANRDAFMAVKQDLLLAFSDCVERSGARLARPRLAVAVEASPLGGVLRAAASGAMGGGVGAAGGLGGSGGSGGAGGSGGGRGDQSGNASDGGPGPGENLRALPGTVDVSAGPPARAPSGPPPPTPGGPASNVVPGRAVGSGGGGPPPSPAAAAASEALLAAVAAAGSAGGSSAQSLPTAGGSVSPDSVVKGSASQGSVVTASFDEL